jgi:D-inositol-3-phosphate glycosyltransferase
MRALRPAKRIVEIPNAVDLSDFTPPVTREEARRLMGIPADEFIVIFFGRVERVKNPRFLLEAFARAGLPENTKLYFVGPPVRKLKNVLLKDVESYKLQNRVVFIDFAGGKKRQAWLSAGDLFALPSSDDSFSVAVIEAATAGTHCLLSPFVGAAEFLPDGMATICELSVDIWAETLRKMYHNPPPQQIPSSDFTAQFSLETIGKRWLEIYTEILKRSSAYQK